MHIELDLLRERREAKINQVHNLVIFKIFDQKTPSTLTRSLFSIDNILPIVRMDTRVDYEYKDNEINDNECIIYYYFSNYAIPPKVELPNVLYVYRNGLDVEFEHTEYEESHSYSIDKNYIKRLI